MSTYDGLIQPMIGFLFVAKNLLGLALDQLNVVHFLALRKLPDVRSVSPGSRCRCRGLGAIFAKRFDSSCGDQYWLNHVAIADKQVECDPAQLIGRAMKTSVVGTVFPETVGNEDRKNGDCQRQDAVPSQGHRDEGNVDN